MPFSHQLNTTKSLPGRRRGFDRIPLIQRIGSRHPSRYPISITNFGNAMVTANRFEGLGDVNITSGSHEADATKGKARRETSRKLARLRRHEMLAATEDKKQDEVSISSEETPLEDDAGEWKIVKSSRKWKKTEKVEKEEGSDQNGHHDDDNNDKKGNDNGNDDDDDSPWSIKAEEDLRKVPSSESSDSGFSSYTSRSLPKAPSRLIHMHRGMNSDSSYGEQIKASSRLSSRPGTSAKYELYRKFDGLTFCIEMFVVRPC